MSHPPVPTPRSGRLHTGGANQLELVWASLILLAATALAVVAGLATVALNLDHLAARTGIRISVLQVLELLTAGNLAALGRLAVRPWRAGMLFAVQLSGAVAAGWQTARWWADRQAGALHRQRLQERTRSRVWATRRQLGGLLADTPAVGSEPAAGGRLLIGTHHGRDVLAPPRTSVMVIAPTRTGKSTRLVVPNLLRWDGPAVVTSVKRDVYDLTAARRAATYGPVHLFDPTGSTVLTLSLFRSRVTAIFPSWGFCWCST